MKLLIILLMLGSTSAFARQYIQCQAPNSWDHAVINLDDENSTLFLTNRVDAPDEDRIRVIKKLKFDKIENGLSHFITNEGDVLDTVKIPNEFIGKRVSNFTIFISHKKLDQSYDYEREMICYSAIY